MKLKHGILCGAAGGLVVLAGMEIMTVEEANIVVEV